MKIRFSVIDNLKIFFWMIIIGIILKPPCLEGMGWTNLDTIFDYLRIIIVGFTILKYILESSTKSIYIILASLYPILRIVITIFNKGDIFHSIVYGTPMITFSIYMFWGTKNKTIIQGIYRTLTLYVLVNLLIIILYPDGWYVTGNGWEKNYFLGFKTYLPLYIEPLIALAIFYYFKTRNIIHLFIIAISAIQPFMEWTAGAIVSVLVICLGFVLCCLRSKIAYWLGNMQCVTIYFLASSFLITYTNIYKYFTYFFSMLKKSSDLTGRIRMWRGCKQIISQHTLLGIGMAQENYLRRLIYAPHAHNFMLDIILNTGIIGLLFFIIFLLFIGKRTKDYKKNNLYVVLCYALYGFFTAGLTEAFQNIGAIAVIFGLIYYFPEYYYDYKGEIVFYD